MYVVAKSDCQNPDGSDRHFYLYPRTNILPMEDTHLDNTLWINLH